MGPAQQAARNARTGAAHPGLTLNLTAHVAVGDPQAPLDHFLGVLEAHGLLGADGWLLPRVHLVSMGDHFDFGGAKGWRTAAADGDAALAWLAAHPADQVTLLLGNHDVARVGELAGFDDAAFARARDEAAAVYQGKKLFRTDPREEAFLARWPTLPSSELAARDFAAFETRQRDRVTALLKAGRFRLASSAGARVLLTHAGVTDRELSVLGLTGQSAPAIAAGLNAWLDARVAKWAKGPLDLSPLHTHGDGAGEGGGLLYHRAALDADTQGPGRRRYPIAELPRSLTQVIGHVRDKKTLALLGLDAGRERNGVLRSLSLHGAGFDYAHGVVPGAQMVFLDGGMKDTAPSEYQLLDLNALKPFSPLQ